MMERVIRRILCNYRKATVSHFLQVNFLQGYATDDVYVHNTCNSTWPFDVRFSIHLPTYLMPVVFPFVYNLGENMHFY